MNSPRATLLRWQFDLAWSLFEYHLDRLDDADLHWEPAARCWTVRRTGEGAWVPDWSPDQTEPLPAPSAAWLTWHLGWWWSVALDHLSERAPRERTEIGWPGDAASTIDWLQGLRGRWVELLDGLTDDDLDAVATFPWADDPDRTVAHTVAWANVELTKNVAEIGQLRLVRAATATTSP